jgi:hypothetical protein
MARGEPPPVKDCAAPLTFTPSATRTCISAEPGNTWCCSEHLAASEPAYLELVATNAESIHLEVIADFGLWRAQSSREVSRAELQDGSTRLTMDEKRRSLEQQVLDSLPQGVAVTRAKLRDSLGGQE